MLPLFSLSAKDRDYVWLKLQRGISLFQQKQYGEAMVLFSECQTIAPANADIEFWIGRIYEVEGDYELAKLQYQKALSFYRLEEPVTADQIYQTSLHLSDVYIQLKDEYNFLDTLDTLLNRTSSKSLQDREKLYLSLYNTLKREGLNKVLELYRIQNSFEVEVFNRKADYYQKQSKDPQKATLNLMLSVVSSLTTILEELESMDISFIFTEDQNASQLSIEKITDVQEVNKIYSEVYSDLALLLAEKSRIKSIQEYIQKNQVMENLYAFAKQLKQEGDTKNAIDVLWICIKYPYNSRVSKWANRLFLEISSKH